MQFNNDWMRVLFMATSLVLFTTAIISCHNWLLKTITPN